MIHDDIYAVSSSKPFPPSSPIYKADYMLLGQDMKNLKVPVMGKKFFFHSNLNLVVKKNTEVYFMAQVTSPPLLMYLFRPFTVGFTGKRELSTGMCGFDNIEKSPGDGTNKILFN